MIVISKRKYKQMYLEVLIWDSMNFKKIIYQIGMSYDQLGNIQKEEAITPHLYIIISKLSSDINVFRLYIYGGHDIREGSLSTLWMLDLSKMVDLDKPDLE